MSFESTVPNYSMKNRMHIAASVLGTLQLIQFLGFSKSISRQCCEVNKVFTGQVQAVVVTFLYQWHRRGCMLLVMIAICCATLLYSEVAVPLRVCSAELE